MATDDHTDPAGELAWRITQQLSSMRCAHAVIKELAETLRAGETVEMTNMEDLTAADIVLTNSLDALSHIRSEVDRLQVQPPKRSGRARP